MKQFTRLSLFLGLAGCLAAQTLSFGEISLVTPATNPPTYLVNLVLKTAGTPNAGQVAGLQFDLNFNPASLNVTIGLGAASTAANQQLNTVCLGQAIGTCATPAANNPSTKTPPNAGPGWRAIIIGCCGGAGSPTSNLIADGVVATLTVQAKASPTDLTLHLPFSPNNYMAATSQGGNNIAATAIPLTVGAGASDPNATGILDMSKLYLVGDVFPFTADTQGHFGAGALSVLDVVQVLFTSVNLQAPPTACSDRFDAMDSAPADTATTRGGDGIINVLDVVETLFRSVNLDKTTPERLSLGGVCPAGAKTRSNLRTELSISRRSLESWGTLQFGPAEPAPGGGQRVPVTLMVRREVPRVALTLGVGDQQSQLHFVSAGTAPSLAQDSQPGVLALGWLDGLNVRAGESVLLGYVTGPAGYAANLKVFGVSAAGLNERNELGIDVSGVPEVQK